MKKIIHPAILRIIEDTTNAPFYAYETRRLDCPVCGGSNTFTIHKNTTGFIWNCFKASCDANGGINKTLTKDELTFLVREDALIEKQETAFEIPPHLIKGAVAQSRPLSRYTLAIILLTKNHLDHAFGAIDVRFDPRENRVVFVGWLDGQPTGAWGRALLLGTTPKWKNYHEHITTPYFVNAWGDEGPRFMPPEGRHAILVEDCISAAAVGTAGFSSVSGVALSGTSITPSIIQFLKNYGTVYVALDRDATAKAIEMTRTLAFYVPTKIVMLSKDLKEYTHKELKGRVIPNILTGKEVDAPK